MDNSSFAKVVEAFFVDIDLNMKNVERTVPRLWIKLTSLGQLHENFGILVSELDRSC